MRTLLTTPAHNERGPRYFEKALAAIHQACRSGDRIVLEYATLDQQVGLFVETTQHLASRVLEPIIAGYPHCTTTTVGIVEPKSDHLTWTASLKLIPDLFPLLRHAQFEDALNRNLADPIAGILRAIRPEEGLECAVRLSVTPARHRIKRRASHALRMLDREFLRNHQRLAGFYARHVLRGWRRFPARLLGVIAAGSSRVREEQLDTSSSRQHEREADLQAAAEKIGAHLFEATILLQVTAFANRRRDAQDRVRELAGALGTFAKSRLATFSLSRLVKDRKHLRQSRFLLSHEELAGLFHPPVSTVAAERMRSTEFTELEAPVRLHSGAEPGSVGIGRVLFRNDRRAFGLGLEDRRRHVYVVGKTGMGKTTLLQSMIAGDMRQGSGVCVVDPHGDLAESLLQFVPRPRTNEVLYFDAANPHQTLRFNPLSCPDPSRIDLVTSGVVSAFKKLHDTSWGPRLEDTLRNAVFAAVEQQGTLVTVLQLLADRTFRQQFVPRIQDDLVRSFWETEFARWSAAYRTEAVASIQNKIRPFVVNARMREIVSESARSLDLRQIMDQGKILIVNLSKGRIGEDNSTLLGAFLVTAIQQAAMTRADLPETERRDFFLYVDEFQNFSTGSFASVLSEARKFRLSLTVAHQYLAQLNDSTADAVFGNVGSIVAFQVGSDDAVTLAQHFGQYPGQLQPQDFTSLPKYTAYCRLLVEGMPTKPFSMQTFPPSPPEPGRREVVRRTSERRSGMCCAA